MFDDKLVHCRNAAHVPVVKRAFALLNHAQAHADTEKHRAQLAQLQENVCAAETEFSRESVVVNAVGTALTTLLQLEHDASASLSASQTTQLLALVDEGLADLPKQLPRVAGFNTPIPTANASAVSVLRRVTDVLRSPEPNLSAWELEIVKQQWEDARSLATQRHEYLRWYISAQTEQQRHIELRKDQRERERQKALRHQAKLEAAAQQWERNERNRVADQVRADNAEKGPQ